MKEKEIKHETPAETVQQQILNAIECVDPNIVLRNLAFWLDVAIAKGRHIDSMMQKQQENGVSASSDNQEPEV